MLYKLLSKQKLILENDQLKLGIIPSSISPDREANPG